VAESAERKQRGVRRRFWRRPGFWAGVLTLGVLAAGAVYVYASPLLRVDEIEVEGASAALWQRIREDSGLEGESMLLLDTGDARSQLQSIPAVKSVEFERRWPRTVVVKVVERQPWGYWEVNGRLFTIDEDGVVLDHELPQLGAPVIRQLNAETPHAGDRVDPAVVELATRLQSVLPGLTGEAVAEFVFEPLSGLTAKTNGGKEIVLGSPSGADYKIAVFTAAAAKARDEGIQYTVMDLSHGQRAILR
jgi:cell division protein FtsQ